MDEPLAEIARLRARAAPPDPLEEIAALRARLARLEAVALAATTQPSTGDTMDNAIRDHFNPTTPPVDPRRKALERRAFAFRPDPQAEAEIAARARDPIAHDAAMAAMHVSGLAGALYRDQRAAAIELGRFDPTTTKEGTSNE
jgi:hypothetical protein